MPAKTNYSFRAAFDLLEDLLEDAAQAAEVLAVAVRDGSWTPGGDGDPDLIAVTYHRADGITMLFDIEIY